MHKTLLAAALLTLATHAAAGYDRLRVGETTRGFRATAIYLDESDRAVGARFLHLKTRHTLDLFGIETVPQAYTWINSFPVGDQGEPHTQEHLLLLKGTRGRTLSTRQSMSLSNSSAFTQQWRTSYFFNTAAGEDVFFDLFAEQTRAMLHPDYSDEEIRREVRFFGVTKNADGTQRLEEQGTVYQEMVSSTANPYSRLYRSAYQLVYGERHPFSYNAGGEPSGIRTMTVEDIRRFQKATHHLANMGTIAVFAPSVPLDRILTRFDRVLSAADPRAKPRKPDSLAGQPKPQPAAAGLIRIAEYPHRNDNQPSPIMLAWPAARSLDANEQFLASLFVANLAGDATTNLYKLFIDGRTRKLDLGARAVAGFVQDYGGYPIYIRFDDAAPANFTEERLKAVRALVMEEIRRIAALPDGSAELAEFNQRLANRLVEQRRALIKATTTPPNFGARAGANSSWMDHLRMLEKTPEDRKSLTLKPQVAFVRALLDSKRNFWREYLAKWQVADTEPFVTAARPAPALIEKDIAERAARIAEETERLKRKYATADAQEAIRRFAADSAKEAERIEKEALKVAAIPFVKTPPMTLDDELRYEVTKLANGVPLVAARFETMPGAFASIALRVDGVPREELRYLSLLPALLSQVGVVENGKPVSYEEMRERLRTEILSLQARFDANARTGRVELQVRASGLDLPEAQRALEWMRLVLHSPNWRVENLARIRDVVDQSLGALRNTMQGPEERWVEDPAFTWRLQDSPHWLATQSFLTRGHNALRLRWQLKEAPSEDGAALSAFFTQLAERGRGLERAQLKALITGGKAPGLEALSGAARTIADEALRDLDIALIEIPDTSLGADFAYLAAALRDDLMTPPAQVLARLEGLRKRLLRSGSARMVLASSQTHRAAIAPGLEALAASLENAPHARAEAPAVAHVAGRLKMRIPDAAPVHLGLHAPNKQGGVIITLAPGLHYADFADREKQLDYLAFRLYGGGGSHGIFLKTLAAGLAYSNGLRATLPTAVMGYYAERTPELPQTVRFVVNELKHGKPLPHMGEYAIAQAFQEGRAARAYELRAEGIAEDLADGQPPEQVRKLRESMLAIRKEPRLVEALFARKDNVYARVLPGYARESRLPAGATSFVIGPDKQLDLWEQYLREAEGPGTRLYRLYGRDYWMP